VHKKGKQLQWLELQDQALTGAPGPLVAGYWGGGIRGPGAASALAPATNLVWRSRAPYTKTPAKGCAQERQAAAMA